jgi:hypothetical protein
MSWLRLDDKIATHRKTVQVGNEAFGAWVRMAAHCQGHATDGRITRAEARVFGDDTIIERLIDVGFLDAIDGEADVFDVHDLLDWNFTAEEARARREKRSSAGKLGGKKSGQVRRHVTNRSKREANAKQTRSKVEANDEANAEVPTKQTRTPSPSPIKTTPYIPPSDSDEANGAALSGVQLVAAPVAIPGIAPEGQAIECPPDLPLTDGARASAQMLAIADIELEWTKFVGHQVGHGIRAANFYALWSKWLGNAKRYQASDKARSERQDASGGGRTTSGPSKSSAPCHVPFKVLPGR